MIRGVTFDAGSTLLYPSPDIGDTFIEAAEELGIEIDEQRVIDSAKPAYQLYDEMYEKDGDFWKSSEACKNVWITLYRFMAREAGLDAYQVEIADLVYQKYLQADHWDMYDDVIPCLETLRDAELKLGIVSNWDVDLIPTLHNLGIGGYFDTIITSALVGERKPQPEIFRIACGEMGVEIDEALHVGDLVEADGDGAYGAGVKPLIIDRKNAIDACPYTIISSLNEIASFIEK